MSKQPPIFSSSLSSFPSDCPANSPFKLDRLPAPDSLRALGLPAGGQSGPNFLSSSEADFWPSTFSRLRLPAGWQDILLRALKKRLAGSRNLRLYLENCQRCGACADKCHLYIGSGDPLQMPVLRAELLRAVYRKNFSLAGRLLGKLAGARALDPDLLGQWFHYFHHCSQCRRCALYCPQGIDCSELSALGRELLLELGLGREGVIEPLRRSWRCGNTAGAGPDALAAGLAQIRADIEALTGVKINTPLNEPGHQVLFVPAGTAYGFGPAADLARLNLTGSLMLLHEAGLDYTLSPLASGMENYGLYARPELRAALARRLYEEAARLGCKWILAAGEGSGWRVLQQYAGPGGIGYQKGNRAGGRGSSRADDPAAGLAASYGLETPRNPTTGTLFTQAAGGVLHLDIFTADLIAKRKIRLRSARNAHFTATFHDSCQAARSLGLLEEPRQVLLAACVAFKEMPAETIRERTFCCGGGGGLAPASGTNQVWSGDGETGQGDLGKDRLNELRLRGGMPRGLALRRVQRESGVNLLVSSCSSCLATLPDLAAQWAPGVETAGLYELLGNALYLRGETKRRFDLRGRLLPGQTAKPAKLAGSAKSPRPAGPAEPTDPTGPAGSAGSASAQTGEQLGGRNKKRVKAAAPAAAEFAPPAFAPARPALEDNAQPDESAHNELAVEGFLDPKVLEDLARLAKLADLPEAAENSEKPEPPA